jgi:antitoxin component YwqK of YwqJK toxin-antitoxin module
VVRVFVFTLASAASVTHADQCSFIARAGGQVSQRSGDCVMENGAEPKNGLERCASREGKQVAQFQWKDGKREGPGWYVDYNDQRLEFNYRDDLPHGEGKVYDKTGQLACSMNVEAGKARGAVRQLYPNAKLAQAWWFENGEQSDKTIRLTADGKVTELRCAPKSMVPEDVQPCGHDGKESTVLLHDGKGAPLKGKLVYRSGKLLSLSTADRKGNPLERVFDPAGGERDYVDTVTHASGAILRRYAVKDGRVHGQWQEFAESGGLLEDSLYERDRRVKQTLYYRNGNVKKTIAPSDDIKLLKVEEYWDSGKVKVSGTYLNDRNWEYLTPHGQVREFREDGSLAADVVYAQGEREGVARVYHRNQKVAIESAYRRGQLIKMTCYDPAGAVQLTEEYFEDGSRKSSSNLRTAEERAAAGVCQSR